MSTARFIRRTALLAGLVLSVFAASAATAACVSPPSGMVAWYPLDELTGAPAINDVASLPSSSVNNVGTPKPGPVGPVTPANGPAPVAGQVGGALYFYTGHYVEVAPHSEFDFSTGDFTVDAGVTAFTIDAWVRIVQVGSTLIQPIVDKFISPGGPGFAFYIRNQRLELALNGNTSVSTGPQIAFANPLQNTGPWTSMGPQPEPSRHRVLLSITPYPCGSARADCRAVGARSPLTSWRYSTAHFWPRKSSPSTTPAARASAD